MRKTVSGRLDTPVTPEPMPSKTVTINPVIESYEGAIIDDHVNFQTQTAAGYVKEIVLLK